MNGIIFLFIFLVGTIGNDLGLFTRSLSAGHLQLSVHFRLIVYYRRNTDKNRTMIARGT